MATIARCGAAALGLFLAATAIAAETNTAALSKTAADALLTRLDGIGRDPDITTANKAIGAADAIEKFNREFKGKPLSVRLKVLDVVPSAQGQYLTANHPNLEGVQFYTSKFETKLTSAEVMSVTKESVLVVTGLLSASGQSRPHARPEILKPGSSVCFPMRVNPAWQIYLENVSYRLEVAPKTGADALSGSTSSASTASLFASGKTADGMTLADKLKREEIRSMDDVKSFFLKGIVHTQHGSGNQSAGAAGSAGMGQSYGSSSRSGTGYGSSSSPAASPVKVKHNRIYTTAEIIQKFGAPSSRSSATTSEHWVYKCKDGVVHVNFSQVGYAGGSATSNSDTLRLEIKSVDSSSVPSAGGSRF